MDELSVNIM